MSSLKSLNLESARRVLFVKAAEEAGLIPTEKRERATAEADPPEPKTGDQDRALTDAEMAFVVRRSEILAENVEPHSAGVPGWVMPLAAAVALGLGFASNELGPERRISILSGPLIGLIAWNLAIYVVLIFHALRGGRDGGAQFLSNWLVRARHQETPPTIQKFEADWLARCAPIFRSQLAATLHLCAALLAVGAVGGMYVRGLAFEYLAGWESTFLDANAVHALLQVVLGPASWLASLPLPGVERLAELNWGAASAQGENAARWIHLYAITAGLWIVAPRLVLAALAALSARRMRANFYTPRADDPYIRRLLAASRGGGELAVVIPYAFEPDATARERLRALLHDVWGGRLKIDFRPPVQYGGEDDFLAATGDVPVEHAEYMVALMNLASTPEDENHGVLVAGLAREAARLGGKLLVLLDAAGYRDRMSEAGFENRMTQRRESWKRMLSAHGIHCAVTGAGDGEIDQAREAVWEAA